MQYTYELSVGFLLGSGVSLPVAPGTDLLTDVVMSHVGQHYIHTDEEWYYPRPESCARPGGYKRESRVGMLVEDLADRVENYYGSRVDPKGCPVRSCTYEDIGYLADSLANTLSRNRDDPGLMPLVEELKGKFDWSSQVLQQAAEDTVSFIRTVVYLRLINVHPPLGHLSLLTSAACDPDIGRLPVYTLNHDCMIEDAFEASSVSLFDFRRTDEHGRVLLDTDARIPDDSRAVLYKPHGSVRWRRFRPMRADGGDPWASEWIGWDRDMTGQRHDDGNRWRSVGAPLILVGRFNKELDYLDEPHWQIFLALAESLRARRQIVISGYGFGDKAINTLLINWLYGSREGQRRLLVMHNNEKQLLASARGSIRGKWDAWRARGQLRFIPHFPCDYTWQQLKAELRAS